MTMTRQNYEPEELVRPELDWEFKLEMKRDAYSDMCPSCEIQLQDGTCPECGWPDD